MSKNKGGIKGRLKNLWETPGEGIQAGLETFSDGVNTGTQPLQDISDSIRTTRDKIRDLLGPDKKRYQKVLNTPIVAVAGLSGVLLETPVKAIGKGLINVGKTIIKVPINIKKVLGKALTSEPKNISYDTLKTKKKEYKISTAGPGPRTGVKWVDDWLLNTNKSWFDKRGKWSKSKKKEVAAATAATTAATAAAATVGSKKIEDLEQQVKIMKDQLAEALEKNTALQEKNLALKNANTEPKKESTKPEPKKAEDKNKPDTPKKQETLKTSDKPDSKDTKKTTSDKPESKDSEKETKSPHDRVAEVTKDGSRGSKIQQYVKEQYPEMKVTYDSSTASGHLNGENKEIKVGTKEKKDIPQIYLHELTHILYSKKVDGIEDLQKKLQSIQESQGKPVFKVSTSDEYKGVEKKSIEDVCEIVALYARGDEVFDKEMKKKIEGGDDKLAKISKSEVDELKDMCKKIIDSLGKDKK